MIKTSKDRGTEVNHFIEDFQEGYNLLKKELSSFEIVFKGEDTPFKRKLSSLLSRLINRYDMKVGSSIRLTRYGGYTEHNIVSEFILKNIALLYDPKERSFTFSTDYLTTKHLFNKILVVSKGIFYYDFDPSFNEKYNFDYYQDTFLEIEELFHFKIYLTKKKEGEYVVSISTEPIEKDLSEVTLRLFKRFLNYKNEIKFLIKRLIKDNHLTSDRIVYSSFYYPVLDQLFDELIIEFGRNKLDRAVKQLLLCHFDQRFFYCENMDYFLSLSEKEKVEEIIKRICKIEDKNNSYFISLLKDIIESSTLTLSKKVDTEDFISGKEKNILRIINNKSLSNIFFD